jgi:hypothetical protein
MVLERKTKDCSVVEMEEGEKEQKKEEDCYC